MGSQGVGLLVQYQQSPEETGNTVNHPNQLLLFPPGRGPHSFQFRDPGPPIFNKEAQSINITPTVKHLGFTRSVVLRIQVADTMVLLSARDVFVLACIRKKFCTANL